MSSRSKRDERGRRRLLSGLWWDAVEPDAEGHLQDMQRSEQAVNRFMQSSGAQTQGPVLKLPDCVLHDAAMHEPMHCRFRSHAGMHACRQERQVQEIPVGVPCQVQVPPKVLQAQRLPP